MFQNKHDLFWTLVIYLGVSKIVFQEDIQFPKSYFEEDPDGGQVQNSVTHQCQKHLELCTYIDM